MFVFYVTGQFCVTSSMSLKTIGKDFKVIRFLSWISERKDKTKQKKLLYDPWPAYITFVQRELERPTCVIGRREGDGGIESEIKTPLLTSITKEKKNSYHSLTNLRLK